MESGEWRVQVERGKRKEERRKRKEERGERREERGESNKVKHPPDVKLNLFQLIMG